MPTCRRCGRIHRDDLLEERGEQLAAWHCYLCGGWVDSLILHHRSACRRRPEIRERGCLSTG